MCELRDVFIVGAARTAIGNLLGSLKNFKAPELGGFAIKEAVKRAGISGEDVEEVIMGNVVSGGLGQAPAKQAAVKGGIPYTVSCFAVNKVCGSALKAVALAAQSIWLEEKNIIVAGGMESMSQAPHLLWGVREGVKFGDMKIKDSMILDGLWCVFGDQHMGMTGEVIAEKFGATRQEQDEYALSSHRKAIHAIEKGYFKDEIVPVEIPQRKGEPLLFAVDEGPREDTALEKLAKLRPAFKKDGTVTAGNASSLNDGASVVVVASGARILTTLIYALKHRGFKKGVASLCLGGGDAVAMAVEMV